MQISIKHIFLGTLLLFTYFLGAAQDEKAQAFFEKDEIYLGEPLLFSLKVQVTKGQKVQFPEFKDQVIIPEIDILEAKGTDTIQQNDSLFYLRNYLVSAYIDSIFFIDSIPIIVDLDTLKTPPAILIVNRFMVDSVQAAKLDTTKLLPLFDIEKPVDTPFTFKEFWYDYGIYSILSIVLIIIILFLRYWLKKRKKNEPVIAIPKKIIPPHIEALEKLTALKEKKLWQKDLVKQYYSELTEIIRLYIERRFEIQALEQTTDEILQFLRDTDVSESEIEKLRKILIPADLVKFAKMLPLPDQNFNAMEMAVAFVEETKNQQKRIESEEQMNENNEKTNIISQ